MLYGKTPTAIVFRRVPTLPDLLLQTHYLLLELHTLAERGVIVEQQYAHTKHPDQQQRYVGTPLEPIGGLFRKTTHCRESLSPTNEKPSPKHHISAQQGYATAKLIKYMRKTKEESKKMLTPPFFHHQSPISSPIPLPFFLPSLLSSITSPSSLPFLSSSHPFLSSPAPPPSYLFPLLSPYSNPPSLCLFWCQSLRLCIPLPSSNPRHYYRLLKQ